MESRLAYRDSDIAWIERIPAHWGTVPLVSVLEESRVRNVGLVETNLLSLSFGRIVRKDIEGVGGLLPESFETYQIIEPNYLVFRFTDLQNDQRSLRSARATERGIITSAYVSVKATGIESRFAEYLMRAYDLSKVFYGLGGGVRQTLKFADVARLPILLPPVAEQRAIADYLDRETARIETLIDEQQRLIETLRERRGATVSSAVGQGLDRTAALKDSRLSGVGQVPVHWEVVPLRYTLHFQEGPGIMAADFRDEGVPLLRVACVRTFQSTLEGCNFLDPVEVERRWAHFCVDLGDLLISASASMGTISEVTEETVGAVPYTGIIRIKPGRMLKDFARWFFVSGEFAAQVDSLKTGSTIQHFGPTHLAQMRVALPPAAEQARIAAYLDAETAKIDALIVETERFIELARERRAALITAAVTGQIDLRGAA